MREGPVSQDNRTIATPGLEQLDSVLTSAVSRLIRRLRAEKSADQISDAQRTALASLVKGGPLTLRELSERERVKPPSMNQTVNALVELGYVERRDDPTDGRKVILAATSSGRGIIEETSRRLHAWLQSQLVELSAEERTLLADAALIISRIADS